MAWRNKPTVSFLPALFSLAMLLLRRLLASASSSSSSSFDLWSFFYRLLVPRFLVFLVISLFPGAYGEGFTVGDGT